MVEHDANVMRHCVKYYLDQMRFINQNVAFIREQISDLEETISGLFGINYEKDRIQVSPEGDKIGTAIIRLEELRSQLADAIADSYERYHEARNLCQLPHLGRHILWLNRVEGLTYDEISERLNYSRDYVYELSRGGYIDLYYVMPEEIRREAIPNALPL